MLHYTDCTTWYIVWYCITRLHGILYNIVLLLVLRSCSPPWFSTAQSHWQRTRWGEYLLFHYYRIWAITWYDMVWCYIIWYSMMSNIISHHIIQLSYYHATSYYAFILDHARPEWLCTSLTKQPNQAFSWHSIPDYSTADYYHYTKKRTKIA